MTKKEKLKQWLRIKYAKVAYYKKGGRLRRFIKWTLLLGLLGFFGVVLLILIIVIPSLPDVEDIKYNPVQSSTIHDREGNLLYTVHGEENRTIVPLEDIAPVVAQAVLSIEDDEFYEHHGVDFAAIAKAVCSELRICSKARGGSTITQQYVKNTFLSPERTYSRKLKEAILALQLEFKFDKDTILGLYLNRIPYGSSIYGIERASTTFFGKSASDLTLAEAAILAAIPKAPTYYSPYGNNRYAIINLDVDEIIKMDITSERELVDINTDFISKGLLGKTYVFGGLDEEQENTDDSENEEVDKGSDDDDDEELFDDSDRREIYIQGRVDFVLGRMEKLGYITAEEAEEALIEANAKEFKPYIEEIIAPHFVMYVRQLLEEKYGKDLIEKGGLKITTTIDPILQTVAEESVAAYAEINLERYDASNASLVALNPNNGQIMAMVGSVDYWNDEIDGKVNVTLRSRLPGSSFKPIVYAAAFLQGYAPSTVLYDVKTKFSSWYEPENYDGKYRGPVSMRQALAHSLNIPAVKATHLAGVPNILDLARKMGIQLNQPDDWYGLSLGLGAGEVRLLDMVGAYSVFATGGYRTDPIAILKIEDRNGNILEEFEEPKNKNLILDPQVAYLINDILTDREARPAGWWREQLSIPGHINGAKTGTSNKEKGEINYPFDTWTIGYTRNLAAGVWAGNNNGDYLDLQASGLDTAGRMWHDFMVQATKDDPKEIFEKPEGIKYIKVSEKTGKLPSEHTPEDVIKTGIFASFSTPMEFDKSYQMVEIDKVSGKLATEFTPVQAREEKAYFEHHAILRENKQWEDAVRRWAKENEEDEPIPTEYDDVHTEETIKIKPEIVILTPDNLSIVSAPNIGVWSKIESKAGVEKVEYYWDGELKDTVITPPYKGTIKISKRGTKEGTTHTIKAIVFDSLYRSNQSSIKVKIGEDDIPPKMEITYPGDGAKLDAGSSMVTQVDAFDPNGDVLKVEFYMGGELIETVRKPPFVWQFTVPEPGNYTIKAKAYDYSKNSTSDSIEITAVVPSGSAGGNTRIIEPIKNSSFDEGERVLVQVYLDAEGQENLAEMTVYAKRKGHQSIEIAKILGEEGANAASLYTFIWDSVPVGTYELQMKVVLRNEKIRFSGKIPLVVR